MTTTLSVIAVVKVQGTMEVEIDVQSIFTQEVAEEMFKGGIANALEVPTENVVKLSVSEIGQGPGLRRLQSIQTKRYEVSFGIILASTMDADVVVEKANRIAVPGTAESLIFRQVLTATNGVVQVRQIAMKVPAHK